jgi:hypothetical protein
MKKRFVYCSYYDRDVPNEGSGCCDFYNDETHRCEYGKYKISSRRIRRDKFYKLSHRDDLLGDFDNDEQ